MATFSYSAIVNGLIEFFQFARSLGLGEQAASGRFGIYRRRIEELETKIANLRNGAKKASIYKELAADLPRYLVALAEGVEAARMGTFLRGCSPDMLRPRLKLMLGGPEMPSDENPTSNQARNIQFELSLGATLTRAGLTVDLEEPDLRVLAT